MTSGASGAGRMAAVSHLFLSELRAKAGAAPARKSPEPSHPHPPPPQQMDQPERADPSYFLHGGEPDQQSEQEQAVFQQDRQHCRRTVLPPGCVVVLADHLGQDRDQAIRDFACHLAGAAGPTGLVWMDVSGVSFQRLCPVDQPSSPPHGQASIPDETEGYSEDEVGSWQTGQGEIDAAERLSALAGSVQRLVMCWDRSYEGEMPRLISMADSVCVITGCASEQVLDCYGQLKQYRHLLAERLVGSFVVSAPDAGAGQDVHHRLAQACKQFLDLNLADFGTHVSMAAVVQESASRHRLSISNGKPVAKTCVGLLERVLGREGDPDHAKVDMTVDRSEPVSAETTCVENPPADAARRETNLNGDTSLIMELNGSGDVGEWFDNLLSNIELRIPSLHARRLETLGEWGLKAARLSDDHRSLAVLVWSDDNDSWQWALSLPLTIQSTGNGQDKTDTAQPLVVLSSSIPPWAHLAAKAAGFSKLVHCPCMRLRYNDKELLAVGISDLRGL